jgi:hypothetical protein
LQKGRCSKCGSPIVPYERCNPCRSAYTASRRWEQSRSKVAPCALCGLAHTAGRECVARVTTPIPDRAAIGPCQACAADHVIGKECKPCRRRRAQNYALRNRETIAAGKRARNKTSRRHGFCSKCGALKQKGTRCVPCWNDHRREYIKGCTRLVSCAKCGQARVVGKGCKPCEAERGRLVYADPNSKRATHWERLSPAHRKERARAQYEAHKDAKLLGCKKWRAARKGAEGSFTFAEWEEVVDRQGGRCANPFCAKDCNLTIDHVTPLVRGGSNWISNIQGLCGPCNSSKNKRTMQEWLARLELKFARKAVAA